MRFANSCYIDRGKIAVAKMGIDGDGRVSWSIGREKPEDITATISGNVADNAKRPGVEDAMKLLYNIALGQRTTTPEYSNQFIDRHEKTFFSESSKMILAMRQDSVTNISAVANYVHMGKWNHLSGVVERVYRDYRCLQASLALLLSDGLSGKKGGQPPVEVVNDKKRNNLHDMDLAPETVDAVRQAIPDVESALRFAEGVFAACCWRDHSQTDKDLHNSKIRSALAPYEEAMEYAVFDPDRFWEPDNVEVICSMADIPHELWIVKSGTDDIVDVALGHDNPSKAEADGGSGGSEKKKKH